MSTPPEGPQPWLPPNARQTPNAERYLLEADALRRRQLRSALLHGSARSWREQRRIWPAAIAGVVLVAVILAAFKVVVAVRQNEPATPSTSGITSTGVPVTPTVSTGLNGTSPTSTGLTGTQTQGVGGR